MSPPTTPHDIPSQERFVDLVNLVLNGDDAAALELMGAVGVLAYQILRSQRLSQVNAEILGEKATGAVISSLTRYQPHLGVFQVWVKTIVVRVHIDEYRRGGDCGQRTLSLIDKDGHVLDRLADGEILSESAAEMSHAVREAIATLHPSDRILVQSQMGRYPIQFVELARELLAARESDDRDEIDREAARLRTRFKRAKEKLRSILAEDCRVKGFILVGNAKPD